MRWLARAGLAARGVMYVVIGWIAVEVAFHRSIQQADRTGALHAVSATPVGGVLLWWRAAPFSSRLDFSSWSPRSRPSHSRPKGVDSSLRTLATTPLGPWLLVLVAIGLIMFGVFSCCRAKWQHL